jgi:hypothetical protein
MQRRVTPLRHTEHVDQRRYPGQRGLDPALRPATVELGFDCPQRSERIGIGLDHAAQAPDAAASARARSRRAPMS